MRRVVVTGAAGRVGRVLVAQLQQAGDEVVPIDVVASPHPQAVVVDLNQGAGLDEHFSGADVVVHLAAYMSWNPTVAASVVRTNVMSTYNVAASAARANVRRVVVGSTGEVYPENAAQYLPVDEKHPTLPNNTYGLSKLLGEEIARYFRRTSQLEVVILRFSHTQDAVELSDPDSSMSGPRFFLAAKARQQESFGNISFASELRELDADEGKMYIATDPTGRPFRMGICETRDLVSGIRLSIDKPDISGEVIGIGAPRAVGLDEIVHPIANALGRNVVEVAMPGRPVDYETSNDKAKKLIGYQPEWPIERMISTAIEVGLKERI